uniref:Spondin domain-containing protein n=1 Tax=Timema bartmani TaxID=61472 RepID=A0A7R9HYI6_9NEOP|nr:unnamed protein product [Timema bartmani]
MADTGGEAGKSRKWELTKCMHSPALSLRCLMLITDLSVSFVILDTRWSRFGVAHSSRPIDGYGEDTQQPKTLLLGQQKQQHQLLLAPPNHHHHNISSGQSNRTYMVAQPQKTRFARLESSTAEKGSHIQKLRVENSKKSVSSQEQIGEKEVVSTGIRVKHPILIGSSVCHQVSLMSKIVPSPDWFVGIDSFNLCVDGSWLDTITIEISTLIETDTSSFVNAIENDSHPSSLMSSIETNSLLSSLVISIETNSLLSSLVISIETNSRLSFFVSSIETNPRLSSLMSSIETSPLLSSIVSSMETSTLLSSIRPLQACVGRCRWLGRRNSPPSAGLLAVINKLFTVRSMVDRHVLRGLLPHEESRGLNVAKFAWKDSGKPLREKTPSVHPTGILALIYSSYEIQSSEDDALDHAITDVDSKKVGIGGLVEELPIFLVVVSVTRYRPHPSYHPLHEEERLVITPPVKPARASTAFHYLLRGSVDNYLKEKPFSKPALNVETGLYVIDKLDKTMLTHLSTCPQEWISRSRLYLKR